MFLRTFALVFALFTYSFGQTSEKSVTVRLLDSRSGKPMVADVVEIWIDNDRSHVISTHTGPDGIASAAVPSKTSEISVYAQQDGWYLYRCDLTKGTSKPAPVYLLDQITKNGIAAANRCSRRTAPTQPGEITLFVRPQSLWEKMKI